MGKQGKSIVIGVMVLAMGVGSVGSMMGGGRPQGGRTGEEAPEREVLEAVDILPLADAELTESFGADLVRQLGLPNPEMNFASLVVLEQFAVRALPDDVNPDVQARFAQGLVSSQGRAPQLVEQMHARVRAGARVKYLGTAVRDELAVARFRLVELEGAVDFVDLLVGVRNNRSVVVDAYSLSTGQWQSELYADFFQVAALERSADGVDARDITALGEAARGGQYEEVEQLYEALPEAAQAQRSVWGVRMAAAAAADNTERYLSIVNEYAALFPNDPSAQMRLLDAHRAQEQWTEASANVDALDAAFPDPYWNGIRATLAEQQGQDDLALELAESMVQADPTLINGPEIGLAVSLRRGDLAAANTFAVTLRDDFGRDLTRLATQPGFEALLELPVLAEPESDSAQP